MVRRKNLRNYYWYHSTNIPGVGKIDGAFDLLGKEQEYLGNTKFKGQRVLEIGPATGHLTFWMESEGASVTCVDLDPDKMAWDCATESGDTPRQKLDATRDMFNAWNWAREKHGSKATVHYCGVYSIPDDIGDFDIAVIPLVLLHLESPTVALRRVCEHADRVVIVERWHDSLEAIGRPVAEFTPDGNPNHITNWWKLSSLAMIKILKSLGYSITRHARTTIGYCPPTELEARNYSPYPTYTLVAQRQSNLG